MLMTLPQVLGILFAVFVACYLPFFAVYVIKGTCGQPCRPYLPPRVLVALEWVAYSGSMLNPIIYHVFNPDFRRAFDTLLRCGCCRASSRQRQSGTGGLHQVLYTRVFYTKVAYTKVVYAWVYTRDYTRTYTRRDSGRAGRPSPVDWRSTLGALYQGALHHGGPRLGVLHQGPHQGLHHALHKICTRVIYTRAVYTCVLYTRVYTRDYAHVCNMVVYTWVFYIMV